MFVSKIRNQKKVKVFGNQAMKINRLKKQTKAFKPIKKQGKNMQFTSEQYNLLIKGLTDINERIHFEILNFQKLTQVSKKTREEVGQMAMSLVNTDKIPFISPIEYGKDFKDLFLSYDENIMILKRVLRDSDSKTILEV